MLCKNRYRLYEQPILGWFLKCARWTRSGGYTAEVDYTAIAKAKQAVSIPVFANGDITNYEKALHVKEVIRDAITWWLDEVLLEITGFLQIKHELFKVEKEKK